MIYQKGDLVAYRGAGPFTVDDVRSDGYRIRIHYPDNDVVTVPASDRLTPWTEPRYEETEWGTCESFRASPHLTDTHAYSCTNRVPLYRLVPAHHHEYVEKFTCPTTPSRSKEPE